MVSIKFYGDHGRAVSVGGNDMTCLPDEVWKIQLDFFVYDPNVHPEHFPEEPVDYPALTKIIKQTNRKIHYINAEHIDELTPEQMEFLTVVFGTAEFLEFQRWTSNQAYGCLANALVHPNSLKKLECYSTQISTDQARLLFDGIALSTCLEHLCLRIISFDNHNECCQAMVQGLQRNRSLKKMEFRFIHFRNERMLRNLLNAAILCTKIEELSIWSDEEFPVRIPWNVLREVLGQPECALEKLDLQSTRMVLPHSPSNNDDEDASEQLVMSANTSVNDFSLSWHALQSSHLVEVSSLFKSLVILQLEESKLTDLSALDPLLIGQGLTLQHLNLSNNVIGHATAVSFFGKLPQMTYIRSIQISDNPFLESSNESWMQVLEEGVWRNTSLECLVFFDEKERAQFYSQINVPLSRNRGGRRALSSGSSSSSSYLPANLWPLVLKRATTILYYDSQGDSRHEALLKDTRVDVVYFLLREEMMQQSLLGS